ncbi:aldo/keto reductase [Halorhabdus sp. CUG00001]|uniref:aldo/keto reductase n=1 Tax=Halorhabdus sp. CUG00001 TaxID=2600297 RepID=UPI0018EEE4EF|nr:aldo/keto reductase [Halorhabdus sp. CUG00001]
MDDLQAVGLGTMGIDDPATIETAIELGYRHLDTAQIYDNESIVGEGIERSALDRDALFVATKVWIDKLGPESIEESTAASLDRLGLANVDLLSVHRPRGDYDPETTLPAFDDLRARGVIEHVGVSNFTVEQLETAREYLAAPIFANQVEYHPLYQPTAALADAQAHDYYLVAYSPLANGRANDIPEVVEIADKHDVTPQAVCLAWLTAKDNLVTIPKASRETHLRANREAPDLTLDPADHETIDSIQREDEIFPE